MATFSPKKTSINWRYLAAALTLLLVGALLVIGHLCNKGERKAIDQTITVRGEATVVQAPDTFRFQPMYQNADPAKLTATGNAVVAKLTAIGVKDADIKTNVSMSEAQAADTPTLAPDAPKTLIYPAPAVGSTYVVTFSVGDEVLAQQVTDYLATTGATGQITPQAGLSQATRSKLDIVARRKASTDARTKAEVMAEQLGAKVGRVLTISEGGAGTPAMARGIAEDSAVTSMAPASGPVVQPGTDEVSYSFTVEFELK